jgi:hypothetical protein
MTKLHFFKGMNEAKPIRDAEVSWRCDACGTISEERMLQISINRHACSAKCVKAEAQKLLTEFF